MSEVDHNEELALDKLNDSELELLNQTLSNFIINPNGLKNRILIIQNIEELSMYLPSIKDGYYGQFPKLLKSTMVLLTTISRMSESGDKELHQLILDSIENIKQCFKRLGVKHEDIQYTKPYYQYSQHYGYKKPKYAYLESSPGGPQIPHALGREIANVVISPGAFKDQFKESEELFYDVGKRALSEAKEKAKKIRTIALSDEQKWFDKFVDKFLQVEKVRLKE